MDVECIMKIRDEFGPENSIEEYFKFKIRCRARILDIAFHSMKQSRK